MARFRMYPTDEQAEHMLRYCGAARYVWNLCVEQDSHWRQGRSSPPGAADKSRQLTEARRASEWLRETPIVVQQQALNDYTKARAAFFTSGFGRPTWRKRFRSEGFRIIGGRRVPAVNADGTPLVNVKTGKQVRDSRVSVQKLNRRNAQVWVPRIGWVRFRLTTGRSLPKAASYRVTFKNGQWHIAFPIVPEPLDGPGTGEVIGIDRGVTVTAALPDGRHLNCPQLTAKERAQVRKHQRRAARAPKGSDRKTAEYAKAANLKAREANRRKDWCEKTSTMLARSYDLIRFEKLNIKNMTRSAKGTVEEPGKRVAQKRGLNRAILAQGWGLLRQRTGDKAPGRVEDVPSPYTSLRCSACGWIDKKSRKSQADFECASCGFTCNADTNAAINVAAGQGGISRPRRTAGAGGVTAATSRSSAREPQPDWVGIPLF